VTAETPSRIRLRLPPIRAIDAGEEEAQVMAKVSGNDLVANALKDEGVEKAFYLTADRWLMSRSAALRGFARSTFVTSRLRQWPPML